MLYETAIKVENLSKVYKLYNSPVDRMKESLHPLRRQYHHDFYALKNISFEIKKGESVGIIGKNGSGKSTLLKILTGVLTPTSGNVTVNGKVSALLELGAGFNPELSGIENVYFSGMLMGYTREEMDVKLHDILAFADIGEFLQQPIKSYSSGMFVRLAFAVAINVEPEILIVDEALSVGDIKFQRKCYSKIEEFRNNGHTIVFVSHDASTINNICTWSILLDAGKILAMDSPRVITKKYIELMFDFNSDGLKLVDNTAESSRRSELVNRVIHGLGLSIPVQLTSEMRHGNGKAEIIDFGIRDESSNRVCSLISGSKYFFYFVVVTHQVIKDFFFAFIVRNAQGVELFVTNNEFHNLKTNNIENNAVLEVTTKVTMWLAQGDYFLSFVSRDSSDAAYTDRRLDAYHFRVVDETLRTKGYVNLTPIMTVNKLTIK